MGTQIWKVYVPYKLFNQSSSFLYGHVIQDSQSVYITASGIINPGVVIETANHLQKVGYWSVDLKSVNRLNLHKNTERLWINLYQNNQGSICCEVTASGHCVLCTCILYNPGEFLKSELLQQKAKLDSKERLDTVSALVKVLHDINSSLSDKEINGDLTVYTIDTQRRRCGMYVLYVFVLVVSMVYLPFRWLSFTEKREIQGMKNYRQKVVSVSATLTQLKARTMMLSQLREKTAIQAKGFLSCTNTCVIQLVDSLLGVLLMYLLMSNNTAQNAANICLAYGDQVAGELKQLLDWLMGAPAGLKLNSQLTHILGRFFQYHIYLWTGYLYILKPVLGQLVYYSSVAGIWGLSVQLAMFQDILSTMTIHIYCFYVYAARLYRLQMYALGSLWRLFRGKKWNVLRERVDSAVYDINQLFVGTLLFTVLLFLLPTTGLYYFVFTALRVVVLTAQGLLTRARRLLSSMPWWYLLMWIGNSSAIKDGVVFQVVPSENVSSNRQLVVTLQSTKPSLLDVLCLPSGSVQTSVAAYSWGTILKNLFLGHLIYPWIEQKNKIS